MRLGDVAHSIGGCLAAAFAVVRPMADESAINDAMRRLEAVSRKIEDQPLRLVPRDPLDDLVDRL